MDSTKAVFPDLRHRMILHGIDLGGELAVRAFSEENHVFALWDEQPLAYFGECLERFDWEMQSDPPLRFQLGGAGK